MAALLTGSKREVRSMHGTPLYLPLPTRLHVGGEVNCAHMHAHGNYSRINHKDNKYEKHFQKMYRDVGMAVPKTTETRCRDGSVQGRHAIQRLHN